MTRAQSGCRTPAPAKTFNPDLLRPLPRSRPVPSRASLARHYRRLTRETFAPVTVLIDSALECLYCSGPTERFLHVPEGTAPQDLLTMIRADLRAGLTPALRQAWLQNRPLAVDGGASIRQGVSVSLRIHLLPVRHETEDLMLVCFVEEPIPDLGPVKMVEALRAAPLDLQIKAVIPIKATLLLHPGAIAMARPVLFIVDPDDQARGTLRALIETEGHLVEDFASCEAFLAAQRPGREACLLIDTDLLGAKGLELLQHLKETGRPLPTIVITGKGDVPMAVQAMKSGASDFLDKPLDRLALLACIRHALEDSRDQTRLSAGRDDAVSRIAGLTPRQHQIMRLVLAGHPNKNIAADLDISQRTVEHHRASIMEKTGSKSLPALARLAIAAV